MDACTERTADVYGEMVDATHAAGLNVNLYYCLLYVAWYWDNHPQARIRLAIRNGTSVVSGVCSEPGQDPVDGSWRRVGLHVDQMDNEAGAVQLTEHRDLDARGKEASPSVCPSSMRTMFFAST